jgi:hypothetical protein
MNKETTKKLVEKLEEAILENNMHSLEHVILILEDYKTYQRSVKIILNNNK